MKDLEFVKTVVMVVSMFVLIAIAVTLKNIRNDLQWIGSNIHSAAYQYLEEKK